MHTAHSATDVEVATCPLPQVKQAFTTEGSLGWYLPSSQFEQPEAVLLATYFPAMHFLQVAASVGSYVAAFPLFHLPGGQSLHLSAAGATAYWPFVQSLQKYLEPTFSG